MSSVDTLPEDSGSIRSDRFVEIKLDDVIPNNVDLASDKQLQRALETWRPNYLDWWNDMGPEGFQQSEVYLRTAVGVDPTGWAKFGHVQHAGLSLGHPARAESRGPHDSLRPPQGRAGLAGSAGRISRDCCAASSSSRATPSRPRSSSSAISARPRRASTTCATSSRSMSKRAATCGRSSISW